VSNELGTGWASELVELSENIKKTFPYRKSNSGPSNPQPNHYTVRAMLAPKRQLIEFELCFLYVRNNFVNNWKLHKCCYRQQQTGQEVTAVGSISQSVSTRPLRTCFGTLEAQGATD
jgi:hypothetical protein